MNGFKHFPQVQIEASKWKVTNGNVTVQVEKGSHGGVIVTRPDHDHKFQFSESKSSTLRSFGEIFIRIAEWIEEENAKSE